MERIHDRSHGRYVPILLEEGAGLIDAAEAGSKAARQVRAILEISPQLAAAIELPARPLTPEVTYRESEPASVAGPDLH
jgi:hypothetical protein